MKRFALAALALALAASTASAQTIVGSSHDFSTKGYGSTEICLFCHTTHNTNTAVSQAPLWNHAVTGATMTLYTSATLNATMGQPSASSKLCLSCHDGTVAIDSYGGTFTNSGTHYISGADSVGVNLTNDHPVSFTFDAALRTADGGLKDPASAPVSALLLGGKVECASCHDVHNGAGIAMLLRVSNASSALCLTCHNK